MIYLVGPDRLVSSDRVQVISVERALELFSRAPFIAVDTETEGLDPHTDRIITLQIGTVEDQVVVDARHVDVRQFKGLLEGSKVIAHNAKFDYKFLYHLGIRLGSVFDTMLAEAVIFNGYENYGYGLDAVASRYLGVSLEKTTRASFRTLGSDPLTDRMIRYAALDVSYLHPIMEKQLGLITQYDLTKAVQLENRAMKAFAQIEYNGMMLDVDKWLENSKSWTLKHRQLEVELEDMLIERGLLRQTRAEDLFGEAVKKTDVNFNSSKQLTVILKDKLGLDLETTSKVELAKWAAKEPVIAKLLEYKSAAKIVSTYGKGFVDNYLNPATGRVHTSFWQVANTFRVTSGDKHFNSPNVQNIPKTNEFRNCFRAPDGYKWVSCDYVSQELAIMADFSGEEGFIDVLNRGEDLHSYVGTMMTGRTITKADKKERDAAKTINFGKPYGMGPPKLAATLQISMEEAEEKFKMYAKAFPKLEAWLKEQAKFGKQNGYILTNPVHKGRRWFPQMKEALKERARNPVDWKFVMTTEGGVERESMNTPIQGTGAVMVKDALVALEAEIRTGGWDAQLVCTVHDQIDVCVAQHQAEAFCARMVELMEACATPYLSKVTLKVDPTITNYWTK